MTPTLSQTLLPLTTVTFPEIALRTRDGHKLRGYFGELFREHSPMLHNHYEDGSLRYAYPLVQYKVLRKVPTLVGLQDGAALLARLFLQMRELDLDGQRIPVLSKHIRHEQVAIGMSDDLHQYRFETLWMALNQDNYRDYRDRNEADRKAQLKRVLTNQILMVFKDLGLWLEPTDRIMLTLSVQERTTQFKNQTMVAFAGAFTANVILPDGLGLGKQVARGFGSIERMSD
ncbi:CRISPR-associated endonuclease Cas6 [Larkinella punicea]|uniref:DNA repair protein n=1 Tax=Larkinella punicea TaxID=2315727 RepID=A0A368JUD6_9BACT|nr:CRISPR-associated endonuclease Cas6 [Larkinella punicea]RCR70546.1 DNA repair protein [Larkinella punicea]